LRYVIVSLISILLLSCTDNITGFKPQDPNDFYWSKDESPIYIEGKFSVPIDETLTIESGTNIVFQSTDNPNNNYVDEVGWIEVIGNISAIGSETDSIRFNSQSEGTWGGIIFHNSSENQFQYCYFENSAYVRDTNNFLKAAIHCIESDINISNCKFLNCRLKSVYVDSTSTTTVQNSTFYKETSYEHPSSYIYVKSESSIFIDNSDFHGAPSGIRMTNNSHSVIINSTFSTISESIYTYESSGEILIENNQFLNGGTAIYFGKNQFPIKILNNFFENYNHGINIWLNHENYIQGNLFGNCKIGIETGASLEPVKLYNSTFVNVGTCFTGENMYVYNSIIVGDNNYYEQQMGMGNITITRTLIPFVIEDIILSGCIIGEDPLFVDSTYDFHLSENSPCIDYGNNYSNIIIDVDLDGNERIQGNSIDIGSYEYNQ